MGKREEQRPHGVDEGAMEGLAAMQPVAAVGEKQHLGPGARAPAFQHGPERVAGFDAPNALAAIAGGEFDRTRRQSGRADTELDAAACGRKAFAEQQALPIGIRVRDGLCRIDPAVVAQPQRRRREAFQGLRKRRPIAFARLARFVQYGDARPRGGRSHIAELG